MSTVYIVATPIGNLKDITLRALEILKEVDVIVCEDTRVSRKLLERYDIKKTLIDYHQKSGTNRIHTIVALLNEGKNIAYISDAGTPGIQDPGNELVNRLMSESVNQGFQLTIFPVPGPSAVTALASVSGMPTDSFLFLGFIPKKKGRKKILQEMVSSKRTVIFYESGHRIFKTLNELYNHVPERKAVVGRELTKKFEIIYRGSLKEIFEQLTSSSQKGEFVVAIEGRP